MTIFISYSRKDGVIAHLLNYILRSKGIRVLIDKDLEPGSDFDSQLHSQIEEADAVLVLMTKNAVSSAWVNQEVGFATAKGKEIWPIALEPEIEPQGMISTVQKYSLFDWTDPYISIEKLVSKLAKGSFCTDFDLVLRGEAARTRFLVEKLKDLQNTSKELKIYHQAAFSAFSVSGTKEFLLYHSDTLLDLFIQERESLDNLVRKKNTEFKMVLWPVRAYDTGYLARRYHILEDWLRSVDKSNPNIKVIIGRYAKPANRLIVAGEFVFDGRKVSGRPGYSESIYQVSPTSINNAIKLFEQNWRDLEAEGKNAIAEISRLRDEINRPQIPPSS